ncbi:hypothetical protein JD844_014242 [Phrynosoma platyrhinos]|uniref:Receptor for retinol uptake STRA6 n=1 Tax=Phrynosoma platyrhinos TaxID=52577 RepID=A0ABQ7SRA0_PHRPL|nr:hypothetical protein JD844_014242 [Phrynosoma platyrhinos]
MASQELTTEDLNGNFAYDNWYEPIGDQDDMTPEVIPDCYPSIPYDIYHACLAPISLVILLILSMLVKRRKLYQSCWNGAPGLLSPMHFLEEEGNRGLAIAVFGILFSSLCVLVLDNDPLPFISNSSTQYREYWKIMALLYYPAFYYPLIACATVRHRAGYLFGCLLSWCHCVVYLWQKVECPQSPKEPWSGYCKGYVKNILAKRSPKRSSSIAKPSIRSRLQTYLRSYIYTPQEGIPGDKELATAKHYIWSVEVSVEVLAQLNSILWPPVSAQAFLKALEFVQDLLNLFKNCFVINLQRLYRGAVLDVFYHSRKLQASQQALVPFWLTLVVAVIVQNLLTHYYFLERDHLPKELNNRRALYIVTYLLFPINVLVGLLAGVWRLVVSALYNVVHFCRLDVSLLGHGVEVFDPGYRTYCYYLKIEVSQSHPVMKAFCLLLLQRNDSTGPKSLQLREMEEGVKLMKTKDQTSKTAKCQQNRARWVLAYTLLNNPSLVSYRKGALSNVTANGMKTNLVVKA